MTFPSLAIFQPWLWSGRMGCSGYVLLDDDNGGAKVLVASAMALLLVLL